MLKFFKEEENYIIVASKSEFFVFFVMRLVMLVR